MPRQTPGPAIDHEFDMNSSAENASRKWSNGAFGRSAAAMVTAAALLLVGIRADPANAARRSAPAPWADLFRESPPRLRKAIHRAAVPLPRPRPAEAPDQPAAENGAPPVEAGKSAEQAAPAAPQPSACRQALTEEIAIAPSIPDIHGPGGCGGEDLVRLEAIVLPDKRQVSVKPAAIMRCKMAAAIADWIRNDIAPLAQNLGCGDQRSRQFQLVRVPRPQPRRRRPALRARSRQCARRSRFQARQWPVDLAHRSHGAAEFARSPCCVRSARGSRRCWVRDRTGTTRTTSISI